MRHVLYYTRIPLSITKTTRPMRVTMPRTQHLCFLKYILKSMKTGLTANYDTYIVPLLMEYKFTLLTTIIIVKL